MSSELPRKCRTGFLRKGHDWKKYRIPGTEDDEIEYDDPIITQHFGDGSSKCWSGIWGGVRVCQKCGYTEIAKVHVDGGHYDATWTDNATLQKPYTLEELERLSKQHMEWRLARLRESRKRDQDARSQMLQLRTEEVA